jgi:transposase-like protein
MAQYPDSGKERLWLERIRRWQPSQLSVREYCQRRGFSEPSFYAWRRVLRQRGLLKDGPTLQAEPAATTPAFLNVTVKADAPVAPAIDLVLAEGRIVRVPAGFDADMLRQLLRLLEEPSC